LRLSALPYGITEKLNIVKSVIMKNKTRNLI
jgi:hypothetical protein